MNTSPWLSRKRRGSPRRVPSIFRRARGLVARAEHPSIGLTDDDAC